MNRSSIRRGCGRFSPSEKKGKDGYCGVEKRCGRLPLRRAKLEKVSFLYPKRLTYLILRKIAKQYLIRKNKAGEIVPVLYRVGKYYYDDAKNKKVVLEEKDNFPILELTIMRLDLFQKTDLK